LKIYTLYDVSYLQRDQHEQVFTTVHENGYFQRRLARFSRRFV
jgi:hypothetical protein